MFSLSTEPPSFTRYLVPGQAYSVGRKTSCRVCLEGDMHVSKQHGIFSVRKGASGYDLFYADNSTYGTVIDGQPFKGKEMVILNSGDRDRFCLLRIGVTLVIASVMKQVRVCLLPGVHCPNLSRTDVARAKDTGLIVDDLACATHFIAFGPPPCEISSFSPELLYALAAAKPIVSYKWFNDAFDQTDTDGFFNNGFSDEWTLFLPDVAKPLGVTPFQLKPDNRRSSLLQHKTFSVDDDISAYSYALKAAGASVVKKGSTDCLTLVERRNGPHQLTIKELALSLLSCSYQEPTDESLSVDEVDIKTETTTRTAAVVRPSPSSSVAPSGKRFRKSVVHLPDSIVDVSLHIE